MQTLGLSMDIRKWLAETENPVLSKQPEVEQFLLPRQPDIVPDARRRRKRSSSDSSLLKAPSLQPRRKGVPANERMRYGVAEVIDEGHSDASHSGPSKSIASSVMSQRYARQPRRKTRADKYDIGLKTAKQRNEGQRPSEKSKSKKSKRKSRRQKDDKTHNGIGQEFQARNVSKDRLTLKPSEKVGLFSKGRTSTSVKGRGLPDLVFSEMRFLRNNHGGSDNTTQAPNAKKQRKKDHARTREEDISAFFTTVRPVLADTDGNIQAKSRRPTGSSTRAKAERARRTQEPSKAPVTAVSTFESEGKALYPGLVSRGPQHEGTSYFSWSESIHDPSVTSERPKNTSTDHDKRIDAWNQENDRVAHGRGTADHWEVPSSFAPDRVTAASKRFRLSSVVSMPSVLSRSQTLPELSSSLRRPDIVGRAVNRHTNEGVASLSSMPPILRDHINAGYQEAPTTEGSIKTSYVGENTKLMQKQASTDVVRGQLAHDSPPQLPRFGGTLQHYNETSGQAPSGRVRRAEAQPSPRLSGTVRQSRHDLYRTTAETPTVRFVALEAHSYVLPNFFGHSIYVQQEQRQHLPVHLGLEEDGSYHCPDEFGQTCMSETGVLDHEDFGDFSDERVSYGTMKDIDDDVEGLDYVADGAEQVQEPEHTSVVAPGFWRPNRLY